MRSSQTLRRLTACLVGALWFGCALLSPAWAQTGEQAAPDPRAVERAEAFYLQAVQFFNEGRFVDALASFDQAIALHPEAIFYCNRGAVLLKLDEPAEALNSMESCLERFEVVDEETRAERGLIEGEVAAMAMAQRVVRPRAVAVAEDITASSQRLSVSPGGQEVEPEIVIIETPGEGIDGERVAAWTTASVAAASLTAALVLDLTTQPLIDEYTQLGEAGSDKSRFDALRAAIDQRKVIIGSLVVLGGASAVASGVLFVLSGQEETPGQPGEVQTDVRVLDGGASVHFRVDF